MVKFVAAAADGDAALPAANRGEFAILGREKGSKFTTGPRRSAGNEENAPAK
jgi:hypothetical protein